MAKRYPTAPQVVVPVESPSEQKCDTSEIETSIPRIGGILEVPANVPGYATYHTFIVATGKKGDVKVSHDRLYVLCPCNNPCMHVLTLEGDKLYSIITCGEGMDVLDPRFFC